MGSALLQTALATRRRGLFDASCWRLLAGPNLPAADFARLTEDLPEGVVVERYRRDFPQLLRRCRVSISQGGYNTVLEVVAAGVPAVVVPFADLRESEQTVRAERLAALGVLEMVPAASLSAERLAAAVKRAVRRRPAALAIDISGAHRTALLVGDMLAKQAMFDGLRKTNTSG
jgi:predicted glycosyltransferase